jgi:1,4-dihydroxy-2-naphthoate octaprenyltransferase
MVQATAFSFKPAGETSCDFLIGLFIVHPSAYLAIYSWSIAICIHVCHISIEESGI